MEVGPVNDTGIVWIKPSPELLELQSLMPIDPADYNRLYADIKKTMKVRDSLKCYHGADDSYLILGGYNRWTIAKELGIKLIPVQICTGTPDEYRELIINDNLNRRHLTRDQKTALVNYFLKKDPTQSDGVIAEKTKVDQKTVRTNRGKLESTKEIPKLKKTKGKDGKERPVRRSEIPNVPQKTPDTVPPAGKGTPSKTVNFEHLIKYNRGRKLDRLETEIKKLFNDADDYVYKDYGIHNREQAKVLLIEYIEKMLRDWK